MKNLREAFQKAKNEIGNRGPRLADLMRMLRITIASLPRAFTHIDALEEYLPRSLLELLETLREIIRWSPTTKIFFTGRTHAWADIQRYFANTVVRPISRSPDEIRNYVGGAREEFRSRGNEQ